MNGRRPWVLLVGERSYLRFYRPLARELRRRRFRPVWVAVDGEADWSGHFIDAAPLIAEIERYGGPAEQLSLGIDLDAATTFEKRIFEKADLFGSIYPYTMKTVRTVARAEGVARAWIRLTAGLVARYRPAGVVAWNGRYLPYRAVIDTCRVLGQTVLTSEIGWVPGTIFMDRGELSPHTQDLAGLDWQSAEMGAPELERADAFLADYRSRRATMVDKGTQPTPAEIRNRALAGGGSHLLFYACQVDWDTNVIVGSLRFRSNQSAVEFLLECMAGMPGFRIVVKPHPLDTVDQTESLLRLVGDRGQVWPDIHAHALIEAADCVVVRNSTVGFEALCYAKPLILLEPSKYRDPRLVLSASSVEEGRHALRTVVAGHVGIPDPAHLRCFVAHLIQNYLVPLDYDYHYAPGALKLLRHFECSQALQKLSHLLSQAPAAARSAPEDERVRKLLARTGLGKQPLVRTALARLGRRAVRATLVGILPAKAVEALRAVRKRWPPVRWGSLRRVRPLSTHFGFDRGTPVDRYYIERFLAAHATDVRGCVLEVADPEYTKRFGGHRVTRSDVLHAVPGNPKATLVGDLASGRGIPHDAFDCIILTQTLPFIYDVQGAVRTTFRALKPGGVLLTTVPGISQVSREDMETWGDYWRFTDASLRRLLSEAFDADRIALSIHGNVLAANAFLLGLAAEELKACELDHLDPDYQLILTARAVKAEAQQ
jgi:SAM-dependent methyltransferase